MKDKPQRSQLWLTILIIAVIPIILFYYVDFENVFPILQHTDWRNMLAGAIVLLVGFPIAAYLFSELATVRTIWYFLFVDLHLPFVVQDPAIRHRGI